MQPNQKTDAPAIDDDTLIRLKSVPEETIAPMVASTSEPPPEHVQPALPEHLSIIEKVGAGGMGEVFKVHDKALDCDIAVKVMHPQWLTDRAALKRFEKEAAAATSLTHPNIAQVYSYCSETTNPHMVMEYVDGESLAQILQHDRTIDEPRLLQMMLQICDALEYAHLRDIVHRDLKPSNIIIKQSPPGDLVKIVDFGIAKLAPGNESATQLTQKGEIFGSPMYMSPEQSQGGAVDARTDLYAIGCIMYEALAGKQLFKGDNAVQILLQQISAPVKKQTRDLLKKKHSRSIVSIIEKLLEKKPEDRYKSAGDLRADLMRVAAKQLPHSLLKNPFLIDIPNQFAVAAILVLGCGTTFWICTSMGRDAAPPRIVSAETLLGTGFSDGPQTPYERAKYLVKRIDQGNAETVRAAASELAVMVNPGGAGLLNSLLSDSDQAALVQAYKRSQDSISKETLVLCLSSVEKPENRNIELMESIVDDDFAKERPRAAVALATWARSNQSIRDNADVSSVLSAALLTDNDVDRQVIYVNALNIFTNYSDKALQNVAESVRYTETNRFMKRDELLGRICQLKQVYVPELMKTLEDPAAAYTSPNWAVLSSLGRKSAPAVPKLCEMVKSQRRAAQVRAAEVLQAIGPAAAPHAIPVLVDCFLHDKSVSVQAAAAQALAAMGPEGLNKLEEFASSNSNVNFTIRGIAQTAYKTAKHIPTVVPKHN